MADVLQYQPRINPLGLGLGAGPVAGAAPPVPDYGRPLEDVSRALGGLAVGLERKRVLDGEFYAQTQTAGARLDAVKLLQQHMDAATGEATDFTPNYLKALDESFKPRLDGAPDEHAKQRLQAELTVLKASVADNALRFESTARIADRSDRLQQSIEVSKNAVLDNPGQLPGALKNWQAAVDAAQLPAHVADKMRTAGSEDLTQAHWLGRGMNDPRATLAALKAGPPEGLKYEDNLQLQTRLQAMIKADDVERAHEARLAAAEAKAAAAQRMYENQASLGQRLQGELAMRADGKPIQHPISLADVRDAYPPHQVDRVWASVQDSTRASAAAGLARGMSFPDQDAMLAQLEPTAADPAEYGNQAQARDAARRAILEERGKFRSDPAGYVQSTVPAVRNAFLAAKADPAKTGAAVALSLASQARIDPAGEPAPLPKAVASDTVAAWKSAAGADQRLGVLAPLTLGLGDDGLARKVLDQLEAAGLPAGADRALQAVKDGDAARARDIVGALSVDPDKLPNLDTTKGKDVQAAVGALYAQPNLAAAEAHAFTATGQPGAGEVAQRGAQLVERIAKQRAAAGADATTAAQDAYRVVYGSGATTTDASLGIVPLPSAVRPENASAFEAGLAEVRQTVDLSHLAPTREAVAKLMPAGSVPGAVEAAFAMAQRDQAAWEADVRAGARWLAAPGGYQLALPSGQVVSGADGKPRVWTVDELLAAATRRLTSGYLPLSGQDTAFPGTSGGGPVPNPFADAAPATAPSDFTFAPVNMKTYARALVSPGATPRREDFADSDVAAIKGAVAKQVASGKTSGVIGYGDYSKDRHELMQFEGEGFYDLLKQSLTDPAFRMATTLGMAKWRLDDNGNVIVSDHYTFDANQKEKTKRIAEEGHLGTLLHALLSAGATGFLNALGNLRIGTESDRKQRRYEINFGPLK